jgi:hypothetical protein
VLKPFVDKLGSIHIIDGIISASSDLTTSANYEISDMNFQAIYNIDMLKLLNGVATLIDWNQQPAKFFGDKLRGAIIGMRR